MLQGVVHRDIKGANILTTKAVSGEETAGTDCGVGFAQAAEACRLFENSMSAWTHFPALMHPVLHTHPHALLPTVPCILSCAMQGLVKLADFGVAAKLGELEARKDELQQHVVGTPYWMAPEVRASFWIWFCICLSVSVCLCLWIS